jgi:tetratricopeptide (TPR) repeat protein
MSFSITDGGAAPAVNAIRLKRQLTEQAIAAATAAEWEAAADLNKRILELGADSEAQNRLAKAYWEMGELQTAREHYQAALSLDPTNRIAERNIARLRMLLAEAGKKTVAAQKADKAPVTIFVEETGKTGFAHLVDLADPKQLAQVNPGDAVELLPDGPRLGAHANGRRIGYVEPRVAARLLKLIADGNKYTAGVTSIGERDVRIIIRETYQDPANYGKVSFPTAAKVSDLRPYTKGTLIREEMDLEDELELDEDDDEIEDIGRVVPDDLTTDEAFVDEEAVEDDAEDTE